MNTKFVRFERMHRFTNETLVACVYFDASVFEQERMMSFLNILYDTKCEIIESEDNTFVNVYDYIELVDFYNGTVVSDKVLDLDRYIITNIISSITSNKPNLKYLADIIEKKITLGKAVSPEPTNDKLILSLTVDDLGYNCATYVGFNSLEFDENDLLNFVLTVFGGKGKIISDINSDSYSYVDVYKHIRPSSIDLNMVQTLNKQVLLTLCNGWRRVVDLDNLFIDEIENLCK